MPRTDVNKLVKLRIDAYQDEAFSKPADPASYSLQINPDSYRHSHSTSYKREKGTETAGPSIKFSIMEPQSVSFEFYLDATGAVPGEIPAKTSLRKSVEAFKKVVYAYQGKLHEPNYLLISWVDTTFKCRLTSLNIDYTLFAPDGSPLRAKLSVAFQEYMSADELVKRSRKSSPDLTHVRTVQAGDTLPVMCDRIYGDSRFYLRIAQYNGLRTFRDLAPGTRLFFPPLGKA